MIEMDGTFMAKWVGHLWLKWVGQLWESELLFCGRYAQKTLVSNLFVCCADYFSFAHHRRHEWRGQHRQYKIVANRLVQLREVQMRLHWNTSSRISSGTTVSCCSACSVFMIKNRGEREHLLTCQSPLQCGMQILRCCIPQPSATSHHSARQHQQLIPIQCKNKQYVDLCLIWVSKHSRIKQ